MFSPPLELTVFDSVCQACESEGNCARQVSKDFSEFKIVMCLEGHPVNSWTKKMSHSDISFRLTVVSSMDTVLKLKK